MGAYDLSLKMEVALKLHVVLAGLLHGVICSRAQIAR